MTKADFGRRLKAVRESKGLSQEELANLIGLKDRSSITKIEKGQRGMDYLNFERLVNVLGVSPLVFFRDNAESLDLTLHERELVTAYRKASDDTQKAVCRVLGLKKTGAEGLSSRA